MIIEKQEVSPGYILGEISKGGGHAGHRGAHAGHGGGEGKPEVGDKKPTLSERASDTASLIRDDLKDSDIKSGSAARMVERLHSDLKSEVDSIKDDEARKEFGTDLKRIQGAINAGKATEDLSEAREFLATGAHEAAKLASAISSLRRSMR